MLVTACSAGVAGDSLPVVDGEPAFDAVLITLLGTDDPTRHLAEQEQAAGRLMVDCMAERGFELRQPASARVPLDTADPTTRSYAETSGFGIVAEYERWASFENGAAIVNLDPNAQYASTLTAAELRDFEVALDGMPAQDAGQLPTDTGCRGSASDEAFAEWRRLNDLLPQWNGLAEEIDTHPDMLAAAARWQTCMSERGYDYAEPESIRADLRQRMTELATSRFPGGQVPVVQTDLGVELAPEALTVVAEVKAFEIGVATANWECRNEDEQVIERIEFEVQEAFVTRHREQILAMLDTDAATAD